MARFKALNYKTTAVGLVKDAGNVLLKNQNLWEKANADPTHQNTPSIGRELRSEIHCLHT